MSNTIVYMADTEIEKLLNCGRLIINVLIVMEEIFYQNCLRY